MIRKERRKTPRESLSPFGDMSLAHGAQAAPAPAKKSPFRIGVYCEGGDWILFSPYFGRLFSGIARAAEEDQARLVMYLPDAGRGEEGFRNASRHELGFYGVEQLKEGLVQGAILLCGHAPSPKQVKQIRSLKIPVVLLSNNQRIPGFFQVSSGAYERAFLCTEQLYIEGRKKVGMVGMYANSSYQKDSLRGMKAASTKAKKPFDKAQVQALNSWDIAKPYELQMAMDKLLAQGCDAIICSEATQAIVALDVLKQQKIKMPRKLCLISFGPLPRSARVAGNGALRLLNVDLMSEGRKAYALLKDAMSGKKPQSDSIQWTWPAY